LELITRSRIGIEFPCSEVKENGKRTARISEGEAEMIMEKTPGPGPGERRSCFIPVTAIGLVLALLGGCLPAAGEVTENPAKPRAKNAGRVIVPKEVLSVSDEGRSDFYFKQPGDLRVAPDGSFFLKDDKQFLQFDKDGRFERNLFKKGLGPGEMNTFFGCLIADKDVIALSYHPDKLIWFDHAGTYEREVPLLRKGTTILRPLAFLKGTFYFISSNIPNIGGEPGIVDVPQDIVAFADGSTDLTPVGSFPTKAFVVTSGGGSARGMVSISYLFAVPFQGRYLALTHTSEYLLKIYDPAAKAVLREFRRAYERVKKPPEKDEQNKPRVGINGKMYTAPDQKYANDIINLFPRGSEIWAVTSTRDKNKGILVDIFDGDGVYQDCFYLQLPEAALNGLAFPWYSTLAGDFLYVVTKNPDETSVIKKYLVEK
jgi:hypothetical protein